MKPNTSFLRQHKFGVVSPVSRIHTNTLLRFAIAIVIGPAVWFTLSAYPYQVQCFKVTFHTLLKWECQREITRQRLIHSFGAKVDRGLMASTLKFSSSHLSLDPSLWRSWFIYIRFQSSSRTRQIRQRIKKRNSTLEKGFCVDGRPIRIKKRAVSKISGFEWTGPKPYTLPFLT